MPDHRWSSQGDNTWSLDTGDAYCSVQRTESTWSIWAELYSSNGARFAGDESTREYGFGGLVRAQTDAESMLVRLRMDAALRRLRNADSEELDQPVRSRFDIINDDDEPPDPSRFWADPSPIDVAPPAPAIVPGSVVTLRSGGPALTVQSIEGSDASCVWFYGGVPHQHTFPMLTLDLYTGGGELQFGGIAFNNSLEVGRNESLGTEPFGSEY